MADPKSVEMDNLDRVDLIDKPKRNDITTDLFDNETIPSRITPYFAILLQAGVATFLIVIIDHPVVLQPSRTFSKDTRTLYTTLTTILATLITIFTVSQIRTLWLRDIFEGRKTQQRGDLDANRVRRARSLLGIGTIADIFHFLPLTGSMGLVALITSAIVASVRDQPYLHSRQFENTINPGLAPDKAACWSLVPNEVGHFGWRLPNGSFLAMANGENWDCPATMIATLLNQAYVPDSFKYQGVGVPVARHAVGTPFSGGSYHGFGLTFGAASLNQWGTDDFNSSTACVPNVVRNPVKCRTNGKVQRAPHQLEVETDHCHSPQVNMFVDPMKTSANHFGMCPTPGQAGNAKIAYGSVYEFANDTARAMDDRSFPGSSQESYAVECAIDVGSSIGFRNVIFERYELRTSDLGTKGFVVRGNGEDCRPLSQSRGVAPIFNNTMAQPLHMNEPVNMSQLLTPRTLVTGAASLQTVLSENAFNDGGKPTLHALILAITHDYNMNEPFDYTFEDSQNPLEDALGLTIAAVLDQYWGGSHATIQILDESSLVLSSSSAQINTQRLGTGRWVNVVFTMPEFFAIGVIVVFLVRHHSRSRDPFLFRRKTM